MTYQIIDDILYIDDLAYITEEAYSHGVLDFPYLEIGARLKFGNGWTMSIVWGCGTYSDNRWTGGISNKPMSKESKTAELAAWDGGGKWITWPGGSEVAGYVLSQDAAALIGYFMFGENINAEDLSKICVVLDSWDND